MTIVGVRRSRRLSNQLERDELEIVDPVPEHPMPPPVKDGRSQLRGALLAQLLRGVGQRWAMVA